MCTYVCVHVCVHTYVCVCVCVCDNVCVVYIHNTVSCQWYVPLLLCIDVLFIVHSQCCCVPHMGWAFKFVYSLCKSYLSIVHIQCCCVHTCTHTSLGWALCIVCAIPTDNILRLNYLVLPSGICCFCVATEEGLGVEMLCTSTCAQLMLNNICSVACTCVLCPSLRIHVLCTKQ